MRQGQQNRRGRGRNQNNRKGQNPLTRSFESNGPDVKIRGTPAHIAEKYITLARDAQSSGDSIMAENYLQHAEHYNRIIMAYREQMQQGGEQMNGGVGHRPRHGGMQDGFEGGADEFGDEDGEEAGAGDGQPAVRAHEPQPQPRAYDQPRSDDYQPPQYQQPSHQPYQQRQNHNQGEGREHGRFRDRRGFRGDRHGDRGDRGERDRGFDRQPQAEPRGYVEQPSPEPPVQAIDERPAPPDARPEPRQEARGEPREPRAENGGRRRERYTPPQDHQPEFLRRPVRRVRREPGSEPVEGPGAEGSESGEAPARDKPVS